MKMTYTMKIRGKTYRPSTFAEASAIYADLRDKSGEGASTFRDTTIMQGGAAVARISYNAKVWPAKEWASGDVPLYSPYPVAA
jgi:hypothetical protein